MLDLNTTQLAKLETKALLSPLSFNWLEALVVKHPVVRHACTERNLLSYNDDNDSSLPATAGYSQENQKHKCHQSSCSCTCNCSNGISAQPWNIGCCWLLGNWWGVWIGHHKRYVHTKPVGIQVSTTLLCVVQGQSHNSVTVTVYF